MKGVMHWLAGSVATACIPSANTIKILGRSVVVI
jgi:hypothetical protein